MYTLEYEPKLDKIIAKWKKSNPILFKKLKALANAIMEDPRNGIGHPEPLVGGQDITYSRHIDKKNRIIYDIYDDKILVLVLEIEGHYNDK